MFVGFTSSSNVGNDEISCLGESGSSMPPSSMFDVIFIFLRGLILAMVVTVEAVEVVKAVEAVEL
jgi:hypothetical protein